MSPQVDLVLVTWRPDLAELRVSSPNTRDTFWLRGTPMQVCVRAAGFIHNLAQLVGSEVDYGMHAEEQEAGATALEQVRALLDAPTYH